VLTDALVFSPKGTPRELTASQRGRLSATITTARRAGGFVWINLNHADAAEIESMSSQIKLHPLAAADLTTGRQQPKVQRYDEHLFIVLWTLLYSSPDGDIAIGQTFIFIGDGFLLTAQRTKDRRRRLLDLRAALDAPVHQPLTQLSAAYAIMAQIVAGYTEVTDAIEDELEAIEKQVFDQETEDDAERIYRLRQRIGKVERASASLSTALQTSQEHFRQLSIDDQNVQPFLQDLLDDLVGAATLSTDQSTALDAVVSTHENNVASRQNSDTRKISAFAALLAIPTVTAGLYGMNFKNLPGVKWEFGWLAVVVAIVLLDVWAFVIFKRRKWL